MATATPRGTLYIRSTTQQLHQGAGMPEECKPEEPLAKVERKVAGSIPTDDEVFRPFPSKLAIMVILSRAYSALVASKSL